MALDPLRFDAAGQRVLREELISTMAGLAKQANWLAEGIYITWAVPLIEAADLVVWLDPPRLTAATRVLRRAVKQAVQDRDRDSWRGVLGLTLEVLFPNDLDQVLASPRNLQPSASAVAAVLRSHGRNVARIRSKRDLRDLLRPR